MKKVIACAVVLLLTVAVAAAKEYEVKKKAGEYDVEIKIDRNPPAVGDNTIRIEIKDPSRTHVTDAKVVVDYSMPPMPGMPPMNYKTDAALKGNEYRATISLSMSGPWNIAVKITRAGKTSTAKFNVDVQ